MDVSVVLATWNNSRRLAATLGAISSCAVPNGFHWQVVVVNNNCTDDTDQVVGKYADRLPVMYVCEPRQGVSRARNKGLETASGELVIFTDDDVKPCPEWIKIYWQAYQSKPKNFFFGGPVESQFECFTPDEELLSVAPGSLKGFTLGNKRKEVSSHERFIGANWACPAGPLKVTGGFDVTRGLGVARRCLQAGEETLLMSKLRAIGLRAWYLPEAHIKHYVPAEKCNLRHIAHRVESYGYYLAWERATFRGHDRKRTIHGIPMWMYREAFNLWVNWLRMKARREKGYREYVQWRQFIGTMLGVRDVIRSRAIEGMLREQI